MLAPVASIHSELDPRDEPEDDEVWIVSRSSLRRMPGLRHDAELLRSGRCRRWHLSSGRGDDIRHRCDGIRSGCGDDGWCRSRRSRCCGLYRRCRRWCSSRRCGFSSRCRRRHRRRIRRCFGFRFGALGSRRGFRGFPLRLAFFFRRGSGCFTLFSELGRFRCDRFFFFRCEWLGRRAEGRTAFRSECSGGQQRNGNEAKNSSAHEELPELKK